MYCIITNIFVRFSSLSRLLIRSSSCAPITSTIISIRLVELFLGHWLSWVQYGWILTQELKNMKELLRIKKIRAKSMKNSVWQRNSMNYKKIIWDRLFVVTVILLIRIQTIYGLIRNVKIVLLLFVPSAKFQMKTMNHWKKGY